MDLIVKGYETGKMSKHIVNLQPGDSLEIKGPLIKFVYVANMKKEIGMIAGGSGITPMMQVVKEILLNPKDDTTVHLLFANATMEDIILRDEIDALVALYPSQFKVSYCLSQQVGDAAWKGYTGRITKEMVELTMPKPSDANMVRHTCYPHPLPSLSRHV